MIVSKTPISSNTFIYNLQSDIYNAKEWADGTHWFGKHFELNLKDKPSPKRLYTAVQCLLGQNQNQFKSIMNYYGMIKSDQSEKDINVPQIQ